MEPRTDVHWASEGGVIDCRVLLGPGPRQLFSQYAHLTGDYAGVTFHHDLSRDAEATPPPTQGPRPCPPCLRWGTISVATATRTKPT